MAADVDKMSEEDIRAMVLVPKLIERGWKAISQIKTEYKITDGEIKFVGKKAVRSRKCQRIDILLRKDMSTHLAVIEVKRNDKAVGFGLQQAMDYAKKINVPLAYSSNGDGFVEYNFISGVQRDLSLDGFPTPAEMTALIEDSKKAKNLLPQYPEIENAPYYFSNTTNEPRYYQRIAIDKTIEAVAKGQNRILIVMATGTGKTYTAFQIIWRLMHAGSKSKKRVLFLADRNALIDQTFDGDFRPFGKEMTKLKNKVMSTSYSVYLSLYQQLVTYEEGKPNPYESYSPDFFDLIIVDECHRSSVREDNEWHKILEYFSSATQIGMTATPKAVEGSNNIKYFGEPVFFYSLADGIRDGFLAPYRVTRSFLSSDLEGYRPDEYAKDINGNEFVKNYFEQKDFGRTLQWTRRQVIVAKRITDMLEKIGKMVKTIVFCPSDEEALLMRDLLVKMNAPMMQENPDYVVRITGDDTYGKKKLKSFIAVKHKYPVVVTTCMLLSTGVDCKTCGLIVIDKEINSMTEFKQIIGRGTRIREDAGKNHLEILDFRGATSKFYDPDFDGPVVINEPNSNGGDSDGEDDKGGDDKGSDSANEPSTKYGGVKKNYIDGHYVSIDKEVVMILDADGKTMKVSDILDFTRKTIRNRYASLQDFIHRWSAEKRKKVIVEEFDDCDAIIEAVREQRPDLQDADIFDIICCVAFGQQPKTRRQRVDQVRKSNYLSKFKDKALDVVNALLEKYAKFGIRDFESRDTLRNAPFNNIGTPPKIFKLFGGKDAFDNVLLDIEKELYNIA
ncbi:MAG: DEAD/DEAH box helicase family protein [Bacteroidales bacterium]|nr:DEAD/DEAH box helicase family protein [Bacteroidales bacterium]